jgi:hypothetical protein
MAVRRILLAVLCLSLLSSFAAANVIVNGSDTLYVIKKTAVAPVIDGVQDPVWKLTDAVWQTSYRNGVQLPVSWEDLSGWSKLLWDDTNLYGLFYVEDDVITNTATNDWERDAIEFYLDGDNSKGPSFDGVNDHQFVIKHYFMGNPTANGANLAHGIEYQFLDVIANDTSFYPPSGYNIEFKIPLDSVGIPAAMDQIVGFELQGDDNDDGLVRKNVTKWWLERGDDSWQVPGHWGTMVLGPEVGTVGIAAQPAQIVNRFDLAQNYPNPFNPTTMITYSVPKSQNVKLTVYNVLGSQVRVLVNETKGAGTYQARFDAQNLSSGVYFYKLEMGNQVMAKKMMLLK